MNKSFNKRDGNSPLYNSSRSQASAFSSFTLFSFCLIAVKIKLTVNTCFVASDCFEIGKYAYDKGDHYHALMWLMEAAASHDLEGGPHSMDKILLLDYLVYASDDVSTLRPLYISLGHCTYP